MKVKMQSYVRGSSSHIVDLFARNVVQVPGIQVQYRLVHRYLFPTLRQPKANSIKQYNSTVKD
jgi:hypothetical protein